MGFIKTQSISSWSVVISIASTFEINSIVLKYKLKTAQSENLQWIKTVVGLHFQWASFQINEIVKDKIRVEAVFALNYLISIRKSFIVNWWQSELVYKLKSKS